MVDVSLTDDVLLLLLSNVTVLLLVFEVGSNSSSSALLTSSSTLILRRRYLIFLASSCSEMVLAAVDSFISLACARRPVLGRSRLRLMEWRGRSLTDLAIEPPLGEMVPLLEAAAAEEDWLISGVTKLEPRLDVDADGVNLRLCMPASWSQDSMSLLLLLWLCWFTVRFLSRVVRISEECAVDGTTVALRSRLDALRGCCCSAVGVG